MDSMQRFLQKLKELLRIKVKDADLSEEDFNEAVRQARAHAGGMARWEKAKEIVASITASEGHSGMMVGYWLPAELASALAQEGGEIPEDLHLTLCYCGDVQSLGDIAVAKGLIAVEDLARRTPPLAGAISGIGRFSASTSSDGKDVVYASVDMPELAEFRQGLAQALKYAGCPPRADHGYTPHVTLAYLDPDAAMPKIDLADMRFRMDCIIFAAGDKQIEIPLSGRSDYYMSEKTEGSKMNPYKLMSEVTLAEDGKTGEVQIFPSVGKYSHPRYGELNITKDFLSTVKANFDGKVYQQELPLTIDLEHESKLSGAAGWIQDLEIRGDKGMWATIEFNDRGKSLVDDNAYKYFSPEFYDSWQDPSSNETHDNLLIGGALTNRPFFKSMAPVAMLTEHGMMFVEAAEGDMDMDGLMAKMKAIMEQLGMSEGDITAACDDMKAKMKKPMPAKGAAETSGGQASRLSVEKGLAEKPTGGDSMGMTEEEARQLKEMGDNLKGLNERLAAAEAKATSEEQARQTAETAATQAGERVAALERDANRKQLAEFVRSNRLAFQETEIEQSVDKLEKMQAKLGEDFADYQAEKSSLHERIDASLAMSQISRANGGASTGAQAEFETAKRKTMSEHAGMTEAEAIARVASENPGLYKRYDDAFKRGIKRGGE